METAVASKSMTPELNLVTFRDVETVQRSLEPGIKSLYPNDIRGRTVNAIRYLQEIIERLTASTRPRNPPPWNLSPISATVR